MGCGSSKSKRTYVDGIYLFSDEFVKIKTRWVKNNFYIYIKPNGLFFANLPRKFVPHAESTDLKTE